MASRSGSASATSCHRVSTTESNLESACWTRVGSGSERRARRPDAVAMGVLPLPLMDERGIATVVMAGILKI